MEVCAQEQGNHVLIEAIDTECGISSEEAPHI